MITLGFGSTEKEFEKQEFDFIEKFISGESKNDDDYWFKEKSMKLLKAKLNNRKKHYDKLDKKHEKAKEHPNRYSTYYFNILYDIADLCIIFKFNHINRSHPFSPDGWAMIKTTKVYHFNRWDYRN